MSLPLNKLCSECGNKSNCKNYINNNRRTNLTLQDFKSFKENLTDNNFNPAIDGNIYRGDSVEIELNGEKTKWKVEYVSCAFIENYLNAANNTIQHHSVLIDK